MVEVEEWVCRTDVQTLQILVLIYLASSEAQSIHHKTNQD